jgi:hypothetical protein
MQTPEDALEQYRLEAEKCELEAREWAAKAAVESDEMLRAEYQAIAWRKRRAAETARRRLVELETRTGLGNRS